MIRFLSLALVLISAVAWAQVRPPSGEKPQPEPRGVDPAVTPEVREPAPQEAQAQAELPKIDLPEFVITGIASIDLPEVEKEEAGEHLDRVAPVFRNPVEEERDRETFELMVGEKEGYGVEMDRNFFSKMTLSGGSYFTATASLLAGQRSSSYTYIVDAGYNLTEGYMPYTKRSRGHIALDGRTALTSTTRLLDGAWLGGGLHYSSFTHRFFGSAVPSVTRTVDRGGFEMVIGNESEESPLEYSLGLRYKHLSVSDSSATASENRFDALLRYGVLVGRATIGGKVHFATSAIARSGRTTPYLDASIGSSILWWGRLFVEPSLHAYYTKRAEGHELMRVYPHFRLGFRLSQRTLLSASYRGQVRYSTLDSYLDSYPYLSAKAVVRPVDTPVDVLALLETDWDDVWRSRFSARYQSFKGYPLYTEYLSLWGTGSFAYLGTTTLATYRADMFAKFTPNSYFAVGLSVQSSKNSVTKTKIPYVSDFEISSSYSHTFDFGLTVAPRLNFVERRNVDVFSGARLPQFWLLGFKATYNIMGTLDMFLDLHNITDRSYEEWRGYRAAPFLMQLGASVRW
jgi:hypothetical protein